MSRPFVHLPVLAGAVLELFRPVSGGVIVDGTLGGGGHAALLLEQLDTDISVLGIDRDPAALAAAEERLVPFGHRVRLVRGNFRDIKEIVRREAGCDEEGRKAVRGVLFDLGVSSPQLDVAERGFSYAKDSALDMRMDPAAPVTAGDLVNAAPEAELRRILRDYGEERFAGRIAAAIVRRRGVTPFTSTLDLAAVVRDAIPAATRRSGPHPARRTFQALRIAVNDELGALEAGLAGAVDVLVPGGRVAVIAYHSLEDRMVKRYFRELSTPPPAPRGLPVKGSAPAGDPVLRLLTRKPVVATADEVATNPRADSAKMRAAEKRQRAIA